MKVITYIHCCGNCKYFVLNTYQDGFKTEMGNCNYKVKFPDSLFARAEGTRKTMNEKWGKDCPCFEWKDNLNG